MRDANPYFGLALSDYWAASFYRLNREHVPKRFRYLIENKELEQPNCHNQYEN